MYFRHVKKISDHELVNNQPVQKTYIHYISNSEEQGFNHFKSLNCEGHYILARERKWFSSITTSYYYINYIVNCLYIQYCNDINTNKL